MIRSTRFDIAPDKTKIQPRFIKLKEEKETEEELRKVPFLRTKYKVRRINPKTANSTPKPMKSPKAIPVFLIMLFGKLNLTRYFTPWSKRTKKVSKNNGRYFTRWDLSNFLFKFLLT